MKIFKQDLVGKKFGELEVLSRTLWPNTNHTAWVCRCTCGKVKTIRHSALLYVGVKSCGCGVGKSAARRFEKKIRRGSRFGKLKVLEKTNQDRWGHWLYRCSCTCGQTTTVMGWALRNGNTRSCGCGQREAVTRHGLSQTKEYRNKYSIKATNKRRAIKRGLMESFSAEEVAALLLTQDNRCHYCNEALTEFHRDHKIPLSRRGRNVIENIALACPSCNTKKNKKTEREFFRFLKSPQGRQWVTGRYGCKPNQAA